MNFRTVAILSLLAALLLTLAQFASAQASGQERAAKDKPTAEGQVVAEQPTAEERAAAIVRAQKPSYPLNVCAVSGEELGSMGDVIEHLVDGRLVRLCCKGCVKKVDADSKAALAKIDAGVIAQQSATYALTTCPISGEELGSMGDPIDVVVGTRLVKACCKGCVGRITADPAKALAPVDAALIASLEKTYPLTTCFVSNEPLEEDAIGFLHGTELVRVCCKGCVKAFNKEPDNFVAKLHAAKKAAVKSEAKVEGEAPAERSKAPAERSKG